MAQDLEIENVAKLYVVGDYFSFYPKNENHCDVSTLTSSMLNTVGLEGITVIKIQIRDLEKLKFYFQKFYLKKENGTFFDFSTKKYEEYFIASFDLDSIDSIQFYERVIGRENFQHNKIPYQCDFIIGYVAVENRFFKLKGFKVNEFMEFYNRYLFYNNRFISPSVNYEIQGLRKKRYSKKLLNLISIDELDLKYLYSTYVKKRKLENDNSCYRRDWLIYSY